MFALIVTFCLQGHCYEDAPIVYRSLEDCFGAALELTNAVKDPSVISARCDRVK